MHAQLHIGTSGWHYRHWTGAFYPEGMDRRSMLDFYANHLDSVEINHSFYRLPEIATLQKWRETVSGRFLFAVKASRYITHMKKLKDPDEPVKRFLDRVARLQERLGPILFQLPPNWRCNPGRLAELLSVLPEKYRYAFEFRDASWFDKQVYHLLEEAGAAFCIYDLAGRQSPKKLTADFVYVRLHGPGAPYQGSYPLRTLCGWAGAFTAWMKQGRDIFCFFDNDQQAYAVHNAVRLADMLQQGEST